MDAQEDAFAEEAQERALLSRQDSEYASKASAGPQTTEDDSEDESSPLIGARLRKPTWTTSSRAEDSYTRAINEPWTGAHGAGPLPWYRRPSVSYPAEKINPY